MKPSTTVAIYFFLLAVFLMQPAFAQEDSKLSKYLPNYSTDDPSALYNGIPNISIPLYTLKGKGISVPVSISYDASGITVVQEATSIGLGWVLNGAGHIIGETRDWDDFAGIDRIESESDAGVELPYIKNSNNLVDRSQSGWASNNTYEFLNKYDNLPDIYYYSAPGLSGKFFLSEDLTTGISIPETTDIIEYDDLTSDFSITTDVGVTYIFDSNQFTGTSPYRIESRIFHLKRIITPQCDTIDYTYYSPSYNKRVYQSLFDHITEEYYQTHEIVKMPMNMVKKITLNGKESIEFEFGEDRTDLTSVYPDSIPKIRAVKLLDADGNTKRYFELYQSNIGSDPYLQYLPKPCSVSYGNPPSSRLLEGEYTICHDGEYTTYDSIVVGENISDENTVYSIINDQFVEVEDCFYRGLYVFVRQNDTVFAVLNEEYLNKYLPMLDNQTYPFVYDSVECQCTLDEAVEAYNKEIDAYEKMLGDYEESNFSITDYKANKVEEGMHYFAVDTNYINLLTDNYDDYTGFPYFRPYYRSNETSSRLLLDSIKEFSGNSSLCNPAITFHYNRETLLPHFHSSDIDHWGYYNYREGKPNLSPVNMNCESIYSQCEGHFLHYSGYRLANEEKMKACILEKITYPNGGYIKYDFEANRAIFKGTDPENAILDSTIIAGGLRIKSIEKGTGDGQRMLTFYDYKKYNDTIINGDYILDTTGLCSGYMLAYETQYKIGAGWEYDDNEEEYDMTMHGVMNSVLPLQKTLSGYVGYSHVAVRNEDISGNNIGTTLYKFHANEALDYFSVTIRGGYQNPDFDKYMRYIAPPKPSSPLLGTLQEKIVADNQNHIISKTINNYCVTNPTYRELESDGYYSKYTLSFTKNIAGIGISYATYIDPGGSLFQWPSIASEVAMLSSVHNYSYYPNDEFVVDSTFYLYDVPQSRLFFPSMEEYTMDLSEYKMENSLYDSDFDAYYQESPTYSEFYFENYGTQKIIQELKFKYNGDIQRTRYWYPPHLADSDLVFEEMVERNIISPVVKVEKFLNGKRLEGQKTEYDEFPSNIVGADDHLLPSKQYQYFGDAYETVQEFISYNEYGMSNEVKKINGNSTSTIWGYNNSRQIASIENAEYNEILIQNFEADTLGYGEKWKIANQSYSHQEYSKDYAHTGHGSLKISTTNSTTNSFVYARLDEDELNADGKYTFSAWIKADILDTSLPDIQFYYKNHSGTWVAHSERGIYDSNQEGDWQLLTLEIDLSDYSGVQGIEARARSMGTNSRTYYWDDLSLYPSDAMVTTFTYDPLIGKTSEIGPSGQTAIYEYDGMGRLYQVRDDDGNILKQNTYHFKE